MKKSRVSRRSRPNEAMPFMSRREIAQFRFSPKHLVCIDMLREGYHRSFTELYSLLGSDRCRRAAAEPGSSLYSQTPLEEQPDKLDLLRRHLTRAEEADWTWTGSEGAENTEASEQRLLLAGLLSDPDDVWLRLHFLHSVEAKAPEASRTSAESKLSLSEEYLQRGDLERAKQQVELLLQQVSDGSLDLNHGPLQLQLHRMTWATFSRLAAALLDSGDSGAALALLQRAQCAVAEIGDQRTEMEAALQLGRTNQGAGNHQAARQFFSTCMEMCEVLEDTGALLEAYMGTVKSLESEGSHDEAVQCLEKVIFITESKGLKEKLAETLWHLGNNYYRRNHHQRAYDYFVQSSKVASDIGNVWLLEKAQVMAAITRARCAVVPYMADMASASPSALLRLQQCKATRGAQYFDEVADDV